MKVIVLIPAAGMGSRMGAAVNKQYLALADRPILAHTIDLFQRHPLVDRIFVISPDGEISYCRSEIVDRYGFAKVHGIIPGGMQRQDSVRNGLQACGAAEDDIVLIHDGARPFFAASLIEPVVRTAAETGGCLVGVPVKDTIKRVGGGLVRETPDRRHLWLAQTPQAFPFRIIRAAHEEAWREGFRGTDDASLVERMGLPVALVQGSYRNIKITTPEDLVLARAFLAEEELAEDVADRPRI